MQKCCMSQFFLKEDFSCLEIGLCMIDRYILFEVKTPCFFFPSRKVYMHAYDELLDRGTVSEENQQILRFLLSFLVCDSLEIPRFT